MHISVDGEPIDDPDRSSADVQRCTDVALEQADIQFQFDNLHSSPRLSVTASPTTVTMAELSEWVELAELGQTGDESAEPEPLSDSAVCRHAKEHLIEMPYFPGSRPPSAQPIGEALGELQAPAPDRLVGEDDAALGQEQLDVPEAQRARVVNPDRVGDDRGREAVTMVWIRCPYHPPTMAQSAPHHHRSRLT